MVTELAILECVRETLDNAGRGDLTRLRWTPRIYPDGSFTIDCSGERYTGRLREFERDRWPVKCWVARMIDLLR